jgi:Uma2 family endonuclease
MATATKKLVLGPKDHGRELTWEEFAQAPWEEGYDYELIDGRLSVAPAPDFPHFWIENWLGRVLRAYSDACPSVINLVGHGSRVFVPGRRGVTCPQPDYVAYHDFPFHVPYRQIDWRQVCPVLVVEVLSRDNPKKDLERNVALYRQVPSIQEYWILDDLGPTLTLIAYRRAGRRWRKPLTVPENRTYTTPLLPGFSLTVNAQP